MTGPKLAPQPSASQHRAEHRAPVRAGTGAPGERRSGEHREWSTRGREHCSDTGILESRAAIERQGGIIRRREAWGSIPDGSIKPS